MAHEAFNRLSAQPVQLFALAMIVACTPAATAQEFIPPRFEGLEQQQRNFDQRKAIELDKAEDRARFGALAATTPSDRLARSNQLHDIQRQQQNFRLEVQTRDQRTAREIAVQTSTLPNRRIAPFSVLVIQDWREQGLSPLPDGQYYARLSGKTVVVDGTSELVVRIHDD